MNKIKHKINIGIFTLNDARSVFMIEQLMIELSVEMSGVAVFDERMHNVLLGFAVACPMITSALRAVKSPYNTDSIEQAVGTLILNEKDILNELCSEIISSRDELQTALDELAVKYTKLEKVFDSVANFIFIKTASAKEIHAKLLERSIAVRFMGGYLRISAGTKEENKAVITALDEILSAM